ncbi:hypothetical protein D3C85_1021800 [compost metagenome]
MLDGAAGQFIARPGRAVGIGDELGHQEQADPLDPGRGLRQPRQHQVNDVLGEILLAAADEDLAAADLIAAVGLGLGAGAQQGQVGAGLGFGEAHGAGPLAAHQLAQVGLPEGLAAVLVQRQHSALGQARIDAKGQAGAH